MKMAQRLRDVAIAIAICIFSVLPAIFVTIALLPVWSWLEETFAIEAVGHSGPAEWCYLTCYSIILASATLFWSILRRKEKPKS